MALAMKLIACGVVVVVHYTYDASGGLQLVFASFRIVIGRSLAACCARVSYGFGQKCVHHKELWCVATFRGSDRWTIWSCRVVVVALCIWYLVASWSIWILEIYTVPFPMKLGSVYILNITNFRNIPIGLNYWYIFLFNISVYLKNMANPRSLWNYE